MGNSSILNTITQNGIGGIRFDFCDGLRVQLPKGRKYRVVFLDRDSGIVHFNETVEGGDSEAVVASRMKFLVNWELAVFDTDDAETPVFTHQMDLAGRDVLVICNGALGDMIAWFSVCPTFQRRTGCRLSVLTSPAIAELFRDDYPEIGFITEDEASWREFYAAYRLGVWFGDDAPDHCPRMRHNTPLNEQAASILGLEGVEMEPLRLDSINGCSSLGKYVCIATKASAQCKFWNNRFGWDETIEHLKDRGYRVFCIDRHPEYGAGIVMNPMPRGCEDATGDM